VANRLISIQLEETFACLHKVMEACKGFLKLKGNQPPSYEYIALEIIPV